MFNVYERDKISNRVRPLSGQPKYHTECYSSSPELCTKHYQKRKKKTGKVEGSGMFVFGNTMPEGELTKFKSLHTFQVYLVWLILRKVLPSFWCPAPPLR
uniref:Uncharacterized protein n=1 Tax=Micrurus lemniscatus lemniscatus TaxID=129467 RepID=A0A2D4JSL6_MICLE